MTTYTKEISNQIYFLNDKNIAQNLNDSDIAINAIPSLSLLNVVNETLSNALSTENSRAINTENAISTKLSNEINRAVSVENKISNDLSNEISTETNRAKDAEKLLSDTISTEINDRKTEDTKLCSKLSSYTDTKITDLSNTVNDNYVHISGDSIKALSVETSLSVKDNITSKNVKIVGNLIHGKDSVIDDKIVGGIALGLSASTNYNHTFVWNGNNSEHNYKSLSAGTFNINPTNGINGFYIGNETLSDIINNEVKISSDSILQTVSEICTNLSNTVSSNIIEAKKELSTGLSSYTNDICTALSNEVTSNISLSISSLCANLSNTIDSRDKALSDALSAEISNANFVNFDNTNNSNFKFGYDDQNHILSIGLNNKYNTNSSVLLSVDTTDFIRNKIVDHTSIETLSATGEKVLRIYWRKDESSDIYTDIPISKLVKIYKSGSGISIAEDFTVSVIGYNTLTACLTEISNDTVTLSNTTIPILTNQVAAIENYTSEISGTSGTINTISESVKKLSSNAFNTIKDISTSLTATDHYLSDQIDKNTKDISTNCDNIEKHQIYINRLSTTNGIIETFTKNIDKISSDISSQMNFVGTLRFSKYHPDWLSSYPNDNTLSAMFAYFQGSNTTPIKNGSLYKIELKEEGGFNFDDPYYAADAFHTFNEPSGFKLSHNDYILITSNDASKATVELSALNKDTVKIISGARFFEVNQNKVDCLTKSIWLSGNNTTSVVYHVGVSTENENPVSIMSTGHAISGLNEFTGENRILSSGSIVADWKNIKTADKTYNLAQLSTDLSHEISNKVYIDGIPVESISAKHISLDEYHQLVINDETLSNVLYVVSSDYLNMYDEQIKNLGTPTEDKDATTKVYVDDLTTALSDALSNETNRAISAEKQLSDVISAEISNRKTNDSYLSSTIDSKIYINNVSADKLSIIDISQEDYHQKVIDGTILSNVLYVVSSDYLNMYDEQIKNLAEPSDDKDATTKIYVDTISTDTLTSAKAYTDDKLTSYTTITEISTLSTTIGNNILSTKDALFNEITATYLKKTDASNIYVTKDSLTSYATKDSLTSYATKDSLSSYATKSEVSTCSSDLNTKYEALNTAYTELCTAYNELKTSVDALCAIVSTLTANSDTQTN